VSQKLSLNQSAVQREGVASYDAVDGNDALRVKVYGRDARDTQLFARLWRVLWSRDAQSRLSFTRLQQVEHEALMLLLAADHDIRGSSCRGRWCHRQWRRTTRHAASGTR